MVHTIFKSLQAIYKACVTVLFFGSLLVYRVWSCKAAAQQHNKTCVIRVPSGAARIEKNVMVKANRPMTNDSPATDRKWNALSFLKQIEVKTVTPHHESNNAKRSFITHFFFFLFIFLRLKHRPARNIQMKKLF